MIMWLLNKIVSTKTLLLLMFVLAGLFSRSQTREDSIDNLTKFSKDYLRSLFNKKDVNLATKFWTKEPFGDLIAGYNNGKASYKTNNDLKRLFSSDLIRLLKDIREPITFHQSDSALLFDGDNGDRYFLVNFNLSTNFNVDSTLQSTSLDFVSWDRGKSWKLNTDHWVNNFMHYLYRRNNR